MTRLTFLENNDNLTFYFHMFSKHFRRNQKNPAIFFTLLLKSTNLAHGLLVTLLEFSDDNLDDGES